MSKVTDQSYVTLATNDNYVLGALTWAHSLRNTGTQRLLTVLTTNAVSAHLQDQLRAVFDLVQFVDVLNSEDTVNLALLARPELGVTFTKLHCWRLTQFSKAVFMDADTLVLANIDELFEREELSAATDVGWPDCFNSGVFVYKPSLDTYAKLLTFAVERGSFDGGDQGLLNLFFSDWSTAESSHRLPFLYNMTTNVSYSYAPAYKQFYDKVKVVHFIGNQKPWYYRYNVDTGSVSGNHNQSGDMANRWWATFVHHVLPNLSGEIKDRVCSQLVRSGESSSSSSSTAAASSTGGFCAGGFFEAPHYVTGSVSSGGVVVGSDQHQSLWERGQIEYKGRDSFENIQAHLDAKIEKK